MIYLKFFGFFALIFAGLGLAEFLGNNFATPLSLLLFGGVIFALIRSIVKDGRN